MSLCVRVYEPVCEGLCMRVYEPVCEGVWACVCAWLSYLDGQPAGPRNSACAWTTASWSGRSSRIDTAEEQGKYWGECERQRSQVKRERLKVREQVLEPKTLKVRSE